MKLKKIDKTFDTCLWIVFILLAAGSWFFARSVSAPEFEVVESDVKIPYEYTDKDGNTVQSAYVLAWKFGKFFKAQPVAYDPTTGEWATFKGEYEDEYRALMPESRYAFWQRSFLVLLSVFIIISALLAYYVGGWIRDAVLYLVARKHNSFSDCAYFLYENRKCFNNGARRILAKTIDDYITTKKDFLYSKYTPSFADLIMQLLMEIKQQKNTRIGFYYSFIDNTKNHLEYLKDLSLYWQSQIGKNENAGKNVDYVNMLRQKDYVNIDISGKASDYVGIVSVELKKLFTEIMGEEVFNFEVYKAQYENIMKRPGAIFVTTTVENSPNSFTWSGQDYAGMAFPGLAIRFTIYHYHNGEKKILWNKYLPPKCDYRAKDGEMSVSALYDNMIRTTIASFPESLKSGKA